MGIMKPQGMFHVPANLESLAIHVDHCNLDAARNGALRSLTLDAKDLSYGKKEPIKKFNFEDLQLISLDFRYPYSGSRPCILQHLPPTLTTLHIEGPVLPPSLKRFTRLQTLTIDSNMGCPDLSLFTNLQTLHLKNVRNIDLRKFPTSLRSLHIQVTESDKSITTHLDELDFSRFNHLRELKLHGLICQSTIGICSSVNILEVSG